MSGSWDVGAIRLYPSDILVQLSGGRVRIITSGGRVKKMAERARPGVSPSVSRRVRRDDRADRRSPSRIRRDEGQKSKTALSPTPVLHSPAARCLRVAAVLDGRDA